MIGSYYHFLYSSRATYTAEDLAAYLSMVDLPYLTSTYHTKLDALIKVEEVTKALKFLQAGKTPGPDSLPTKNSTRPTQRIWCQVSMPCCVS